MSGCRTDGFSASGATLFLGEPRAQAMTMEHVATVQFFHTSFGNHILETNHTDIVSTCQIFSSGVGKSCVEFGHNLAITNEIENASVERDDPNVEITNQMKRESVKEENDAKEEDVDEALNEIVEDFEVKSVGAFVWPAIVAIEIDEMKSESQ